MKKKKKKEKKKSIFSSEALVKHSVLSRNDERDAMVLVSGVSPPLETLSALEKINTVEEGT